MTLIDVVMNYSKIFSPTHTGIRRAALLEMTPAQLETEAKEFCGGAPWEAWEQIQATRAAFDALSTP